MHDSAAQTSSEVSGKNYLSWILGRRDGLVLLLILTAAFFLRYHNLGDLSFFSDEDILYINVKGILATGFPITPSGIFYTRGLIHSYMVASSAYFFGLNEMALRLPSLFFSILTLALFFRFAKELFGARVALIASGLIAISAWDIEMARCGRAFEPFLFFYLASAYCFYKGFIKGGTIYQYLVPVLFVITTAIHSVVFAEHSFLWSSPGVFLLLLFICPFLMKEYKIMSYSRLGSYILVIFLFDGAYMWFENYQYGRMMQPLILSRGPPYPNAFLERVQGLLPALNWRVGLTYLVLAALGLWHGRRLIGISTDPRVRNWSWTIFATLSIVILARQFGIAIWIFAYALFLSYKGWEGLKDRLCQTYGSLLLSGFAVWLLSGVYEAVSLRPNEQILPLIKATIRSLTDYPFINTGVLLSAMPAMTPIALFGAMGLYDRASRDSDSRGKLVVLVGFIGPLVVIGFLGQWHFRNFLYMVYPFFVLIYVWFIDATSSYTFSRILRRSPRLVTWVALPATLIVTLAFADLHSFGLARSIANRGYDSVIRDLALFRYTRHPDFKTTAQFVKTELHPEDIVISIDSLMTFVYLGRVDYLLRTEGVMEEGLQLRTEPLIGTPLLRSLGMLQDVLRSKNGRKVWFITSAELMGPHAVPSLSPEIMNFLETNKDNVVYTGKDGITKVYLLN